MLKKIIQTLKKLITIGVSKLYDRFLVQVYFGFEGFSPENQPL